MEIGIPELLIVLAIVVILFGVGRVAKLGGEMGSALREFRRGLRGEGSADEQAAPEEQPREAHQNGNLP